MKDIEQDNRICLFYVTERLIDLNKIANKRKKAYTSAANETYLIEKSLKEFERECIYNLGINALHNHNN
tara:strand:+ start:49 stop:255 length:207 start_codon:yes stop_codon:yes gene_type:complete